MSTNTEKFGMMFMSQGAESYKNISIQSKYFLELMTQQYKLAEEQARTWAPDPEHGIVAEMLAAVDQGAKAAGDVYRQEAVNAIISASVAAGSMVGVVAMHLNTSTTEVQGKLDDATQMKDDLNEPVKPKLSLEEEEELQPAAPKPDSVRDQQIKEKINDWANKGGKTFENYNKKMPGLKEELPDDVSNQNQLNKEAVEQAKTSPERDKIQKNLDDYINDLKQEKSKLENQFWQASNMIMQLQNPVSQGLSVKQDLQKAEDQTESQVAQGVSQVLGDAEKKQSQFFETTAQKAAQFAEAADSVASSLGQIMQNRSGA